MSKWRWRGAGVTVGAAVAAGLGATGQWQGGLAGAALIAAGGFIAPEASEWLKNRRIRASELVAAERAARTALDIVSGPAVVPAADQPLGGAAYWLRPEQRVVGFIDRPELARLREWCEGQGTPEVTLLTGAGGVGKTRLALRLAEKQQDRGWMCRIVRMGAEADVVDKARRVSGGPLLLVVDYAETRAGLAGLLKDAAGDGGDRLKILLLARGAGDWWAQLEAAADVDVRMLAAAAGRVLVSKLAGGAASGAELVRAAVPAFARVVGVAAPRQIHVTVPDGPVPILVLHAAALLAVLDAGDSPHVGPMQVVADEQVLAVLLGREKAFWLGSTRTAELSGPGGMDLVTAAQAVAVACLITVSDESAAAQALCRVPGLADSSSGVLLRIARWLRQLYPADQHASAVDSGRWWGSLQPDLLAERHVVSELADSPSLARACLRDLTAAQTRGALTVLARACAHHPKAPGIIGAALRADLSGLGVPAVQVAVQTGGGLGGILASAVSDADPPLDTMIQIEKAIPFPTVVLAEADVILVERIIRTLPDDTDRAEIAWWHDLLGNLLSQAGRPHEAVLVSQQAVVIRRELVQVMPDRYLPDLAASLDNLGICLSELGRPAEALPVTQEAVVIRRELAQVTAGRYLSDLATSLDNLGVFFSALERPAEALSVTREALAAYRKLAASSPDRYQSDLARSLSNLGIRFFKLGRPAEALPVTQEAVVIRRELAQVMPDRYRPNLAASLDNLGIYLSELGRSEEALPVTQEAVLIRRELAQVMPDRYRPDLAVSLDNLGSCLSEVGRPEEALPATEEAVLIRRELAQVMPDRYLPDLAVSLDNLGSRLYELNHPAEALPVIQEALAAYRELAVDPGRYRPELSRLLDNLGILLSKLGRNSEAFAARKEALVIRNSLSR